MDVDRRAELDRIMGYESNNAVKSYEKESHIGKLKNG